MAAGTLEQITSVASPQPGTSNQPYPVGKLPPFVPVNVTVIDEPLHSAFIIAKTNALTAQLHLTNAALNQINNNISKLLAESASQIKKISEIETGFYSWGAVKSNQTALMAAEISSNIKSNNFYKASSVEQPSMPMISDQIDESIKQATVYNSIAFGTVTSQNFISTQATSVQKWLLGTETYKTVSSYIKDKISVIQTAIVSGYNSIISNLKAIAGNGSI